MMSHLSDLLYLVAEYLCFLNAFMNTLLITFILLLVLKLVASMLLDILNLRYAQSKRGTVPESFTDFMDEASYQKSIDYTVAKTRFGLVHNFYDAALLALSLIHI